MEKGLSIIIRNEKEFNKIKDFLGGYLYLNYMPQMATTETAIVICYDNPDEYSIGSVGCVKSQKEQGIRTVEFSNFFKL